MRSVLFSLESFRICFSVGISRQAREPYRTFSLRWCSRTPRSVITAAHVETSSRECERRLSSNTGGPLRLQNNGIDFTDKQFIAFGFSGNELTDKQFVLFGFCLGFDLTVK